MSIRKDVHGNCWISQTFYDGRYITRSFAIQKWTSAKAHSLAEEYDLIASRTKDVMTISKIDFSYEQLRDTIEERAAEQNPDLVDRQKFGGRPGKYKPEIAFAKLVIPVKQLIEYVDEEYSYTGRIKKVCEFANAMPAEKQFEVLDNKVPQNPISVFFEPLNSNNVRAIVFLKTLRDIGSVYEEYDNEPETKGEDIC